MQEGAEEQDAPTGAQQDFERGRQQFRESSLENACYIRRTRTLSEGSYTRIVENADKVYARSYGSLQTVKLLSNPSNILYAASYIPGPTGVIAGVGEAAFGYHNGTHDMMDVIQVGISGSLGFASKGMQNLGTAAKGVSRLDKASRHSSSSAVSSVPDFMTRSHNPKAAIFARTTQDDLGISTRAKLFGTDQVFQFRADRVRPIGDARPRNFEKAGQVFAFDKQYLSKRLKDVTDVSERRAIINETKLLQSKYPHGIPFTGSGFPDFSRYAVKKVGVPFSGSRRTDELLANKAAGFSETPAKHTWHHHENAKEMVLVPEDLHNAVKHTGGFAIDKGVKK